MFAYDRKTREPYWQSGIARSNSNSKATWVLGIGPFQRGTIHSGTQFAGSQVHVLPTRTPDELTDQEGLEQYLSSQTFHPRPAEGEVIPVTHEESGPSPPKD